MYMHNTRITPLNAHLLNSKGKNVPTHSLFFTSDSKTYAPKTIVNNPKVLAPSVTISHDSFHHKENEILPTMEWKPSFSVDSSAQGENGEPEKIGFIILRHTAKTSTPKVQIFLIIKMIQLFIIDSRQ